MFSAILVTASATIILLLGIVHLVYTFTGLKLTPRDPDLTSEMKLVSPVISNETSMWKAWVGFNASHSMGAILFGLIYGYLALLRADLLFGSIYLMLVGLAMLAGLFVLARRYWFSIPFAGITISLLLFIGGIATAKQTSTSTFSNATVSPAVAHDSTASMLFFHEAQLRAFAGQTELVLQLFPKTRKSADEPQCG